MTGQLKNNLLKTFKPDIEDVARRWQAYWNGDIIDRPIVRAYCKKEGFPARPETASYHERVYGDIIKILEDELSHASKIYYGGDSVPFYQLSFGPDEIAVFCGGNLQWNKDSGDTNWSEPFIDEWEKQLPLKLKEDSPLWKRMLNFYERAADTFNGRIICTPPDFHTNMDLLLAVRGGERLCIDLIDNPEAIDRAMEDCRQIFKSIWQQTKQAGRMDEFGYFDFVSYSPEKSICRLSCDFSYMIGPDMFKRWVLPTIEFEASLVDYVFYHWDGPGALIHEKDIVSVDKIHTIGYTPNVYESCTQFTDLFKRLQKAGKAIEVVGTVEEIKFMHKELNPAKTMYYVMGEPSQEEVEKLLQWLIKNT